MKNIHRLTALILLTFSVFGFSSGALAQAKFSIELNPSPVITVVGTKAEVVIKGTFDAASGKYLKNDTYDTLMIRYAKYVDGRLPVLGEAEENVLNTDPTKGFVSAGCFTSGTKGEKYCRLTYNGDSSGSVEAMFSGLTDGKYAFFAFFKEPGVAEKYHPIGTGGKDFTVRGAQGDVPVLVEFVSVNVNGHDATVRVSVKHVPVKVQGYMQLGTASQIGKTSNYLCVPGSWSSPAVAVEPTTEENASVVPFTFKNLEDGNYCVRVQVAIPPAGTLVNAGNPAAVDGNGFFKGRDTLFSVGSAVLAVGATNDGNANPTGCVTESDNSNYCLLAPLPGVGDETGSFDATKGFGDYVKMIIRIVMGLIGVLSVLMIVVGGIEYMSTVSIGEKEGAKSRISNAIFGLLLALSSYIILNTLNPSLVNLGVKIPSVELTLGPGDETDDTPTTPLPATTKAATVTIPTGTAQSLAAEILKNPNITFATELGGDIPSGARQNLEDTVSGLGAMRSKRGHFGATRIPLQADMLAGLLAVGNSVKIQVNEIAGAAHSSTSKHYSGRAFDLQASRSDMPRAKKILSICQAAGAKVTIGPCSGTVTKEGICLATGYHTDSGHQTHVHCGW